MIRTFSFLISLFCLIQQQIQDVVLGITLLLADFKNNVGGWKGNFFDIDARKNQSVEGSFNDLCKNFNDSEAVDCFNVNSFSAGEIVQKVTVDKINLR